MWFSPAWFRRKLLDLVPSKKVQRLKDICDRLTAGCVKIFDAKKAAMKSGDDDLLQNVGEGRDVMSVLRTSIASRLISVQPKVMVCFHPFVVRENMLAAQEDKLPEDELLAQMAYVINAVLR